jgi:microcystin-dependent protein
MEKLSYARRLAGSVALTATVAIATTVAAPAAAQENYLGQIIPVAFTFCPRGTVSAEGQLLAINQNQALFSLYGTNFGGDGRTTFAMPDLRGRSPMGNGTGPGLSFRALGQKGGDESTTLDVTNLPGHTHTVNANNADGDKAGPGGKLLAAAPTGGSGNETIYSTALANVTMNPAMIGHTGGNQPMSTVDPYITIRYCIVTQGLFPSRN